MSRILIPLDGTNEAEQVLSDASALAGRDGEIILLRVIRPVFNTPIGVSVLHETERLSTEYLERAASPMRDAGSRVRTITRESSHVSATIDQVVADEGVDMIACATHGRGPTSRLIHGSTAWRMIAGSSVPVYLIHTHDDHGARPMTNRTQVMVPLDGSPYSEKALPVAENFARQWGSAISLVRVVEVVNSFVAYGSVPPPIDYEADQKQADRYLQDVAERLGCTDHRMYRQ